MDRNNHPDTSETNSPSKEVGILPSSPQSPRSHTTLGYCSQCVHCGVGLADGCPRQSPFHRLVPLVPRSCVCCAKGPRTQSVQRCTTFLCGGLRETNGKTKKTGCTTHLHLPNGHVHHHSFNCSLFFFSLGGIVDLKNKR